MVNCNSVPSHWPWKSSWVWFIPWMGCRCNLAQSITLASPETQFHKGSFTEPSAQPPLSYQVNKFRPCECRTSDGCPRLTLRYRMQGTAGRREECELVCELFWQDKPQKGQHVSWKYKLCPTDKWSTSRTRYSLLWCFILDWGHFMELMTPLLVITRSLSMEKAMSTSQLQLLPSSSFSLCQSCASVMNIAKP